MLEVRPCSAPAAAPASPGGANVAAADAPTKAAVEPSPVPTGATVGAPSAAAPRRKTVRQLKDAMAGGRRSHRASCRPDHWWLVCVLQLVRADVRLGQRALRPKRP